LEGFGNIRIKLYSQVSLGHNLCVPFLDLCLNPGLELLTNQRICHVANPLARQLVEISLFREEVLVKWILVDLSPNLFHSQGFVLRYKDVLHRLTLDD
jgi:hypothetical protein